MTNATAFSSSAKPLTYYADTAQIRSIAEDYGDRLEVLSASEKYQLIHCLTGYLAQRIDGDADETDSILAVAEDCSNLSLYGDVEAVLKDLQHEDPNIISALIPAIAQYAHDDKRDD